LALYVAAVTVTADIGQRVSGVVVGKIPKPDCR